MKKLISLLLTVVMSIACLGMFTACNKTEKVAALICLHGDNSSYDKNFIDAFKAACEAKGLTEDQYTIVTDIPEGPECYDKAAEFADEGYKVVFADSFGHEKYMRKAANEFPEVQFCHATGDDAGFLTTANKNDDAPANFHNAFASIYEGRYLAGVAAGMKLQEMITAGLDAKHYDDKGNVKIGYVGAHPYAEVISGYTSFFLGVRAIINNVVMDVTYTGSWYDEILEKTAAEALIDRGAALVSGHADSNGVPTACKEAGIPNVFYNGISNENTFVIASKINWQPYFEHMLDGVIEEDGEIVADYCGTLATGSVQVTALGAAAAEGTQTKLEEVKAKLMNGEIKVFDVSTFTVGGETLTEYLADVVNTGDFQGETNVIKTANGKTYFAESEFRSAPYFDIIIDGITIIS